MTQLGFFDIAERSAKLTQMYDPLVGLNSQINWEAFLANLNRVHQKGRKSKAGPKPINVVLMCWRAVKIDLLSTSLTLFTPRHRDERVYQVLSQRLSDNFNIFKALLDTIDDEWIDAVEVLGKEIDRYIEKRSAAKNAFEIHY